MSHTTFGIIYLCALLYIGCTEPQQPETFNRGLQTREDDHGLSKARSPHKSHRLSHHTTLDLDYNRMLESFGISDNISNIQDDHRRSINALHKVGRDPETGRCRNLQCDQGRECRINIQTGDEGCVCRQRCSSRYNPVCGTDGKWYHNRCSLHRASCTENHPVHIVDSPGKHCDQQTTTQIPKKKKKSNSRGKLEAGSCSLKEYAEFKGRLLLHVFDQFLPLGSPVSQSPNAKQEILRHIWETLDGNRDNVVSQKELEIPHDQLELPPPCRLDELLRNEDLDEDGQLDFRELLTAYGFGKTVWPSQHHQWTAIAGNSIEIPCEMGQTSSTAITWERNHAKLNGREEETGLHVNEQSGTLYATHLQLIHSGNYSCFHQQLPHAQQTHHLRVLVSPEVEVEFRQRFYQTGTNVSVRCHTAGVPAPLLRWFKNKEPLKDTSGYLRIPHVEKSDTGVYQCMAESEAGRSSASTSLFVVDNQQANPATQKLFIVFFAGGISAFEPDKCQAQFNIRSNDIIPGTSQLLCGNDFAKCEWGSTVNVMDRYIYASQPLLDRVVVLSLQQMLIVQVISTDKVPVNLHYVPYLDQVWVLCWRSIEETQLKTIQVIRDASSKLEHNVVHLEPVHGKYLTVTNFFPPPAQELAQRMPFAFASSSDGSSLDKIDMRSLRWIATIDLTSSGCRPHKVTYSSIGGFVFVDCVDIRHGTPKGQLILDYVTNAVLKQDQSISGDTYISPDSRRWVNLGTDVIRIQEIQETGLSYVHDVVMPSHIADVVFHPSRSNQSYDLYATSLTTDQLFLVELDSHSLTSVTNTGFGSGRKFNRWNYSDARFVVSDGVFGSHLVTAAKNSIFITNTVTRNLNCEINQLLEPQHAVWVQRLPEQI